MCTSMSERVDVALVLAIDYSGSISDASLALQVRGYVNAVLSDVFINAVQSGPRGKIALTVLKWSDDWRNEQVVPWICVDGMPAAKRLAAKLSGSPGLIPGHTSISGAIDRSIRLLTDNEFTASRRIIDISGDGINNDGRPVTAARDSAVAQGIVINGLPLVNQEPNIAEYYAQNVIGGIVYPGGTLD
jgi:Protein of unknown function (DUF1194)